MRHAGKSALRVVCCAAAAGARRGRRSAVRQRHDPRHRHRRVRRRDRRRQGHRPQRGHRRSPAPSTADANGEYTAPSLPTGRYTVMAEIAGLQGARALEHRGRRRPARPHRPQARGRRDDRVGQHPGRDAAGPDLVVRARARPSATSRSRRCRSTAATSSTSRAPSPACCAAFPAPTSTAPAASPGAPRRRSRPTASGRATTTTCSTASTTTRPGSRPSSSSRASTRSTSSSCRPAPTRPSSAARSAASSTCRSSRAPTSCAAARFEFHRNDAFDANNFFNNTSRPRQAGLQAEPVRRHRRRPDLQGQDVLLRATTRATARPRARRACPPCRRWRCASGDFSELNRVIYDPTDRPAVPRQRHPRRTASTRSRATSSTQLYPEPNTAGTRQANGQVINNYLINPIKERQDNQFDVKVDHNLTANNRFFTRYSFEKTHRLQPATLPHGDAGATFGAGDGNIKAQSLAFNDTHTLQAEPAERVPLRLVVDQVPHDVDRLRHQPGRRRSACPASTSTR